MTNLPSDQINQVKPLIDQAQSVLIVTHSNATLDSLAASLSLYLALTARGKQVSVSCPDQIRVEFSHLVGLDKISSNPNLNEKSGKNLVISFPYEEGSIEKVSYNIENGSFNLVVEPREGYPQITPEVINYSFSGNGGDNNLIITVDTPQLTSLGQIFQNNQSFFSEKPVINIDSHPQNSRYGRINLVDNSVSCTSELVASLFSMLGLTIDPDISGNLYAGIVDGTKNFTSPQTTAGTFETVALCLKSGTKKTSSSSVQPSPGFNQNLGQNYPSPFAPFSPPIKQQTYSTPSQKPNFGQFQRQPFMQKNPVKKPTNPTPAFHQPEQGAKNQQNEAPPDWLKPKIFKGSTLL
ncbi:DHH family phosphoesterase [Candidatus Microgenomates bacterium]|nr:DHH family phosphoesterase [Candidatus Microgenomates bacterium]